MFRGFLKGRENLFLDSWIEAEESPIYAYRERIAEFISLMDWSHSSRWIFFYDKENDCAVLEEGGVVRAHVVVTVLADESHRLIVRRNFDERYDKALRELLRGKETVFLLLQ